MNSPCAEAMDVKKRREDVSVFSPSCFNSRKGYHGRQDNRRESLELSEFRLVGAAVRSICTTITTSLTTVAATIRAVAAAGRTRADYRSTMAASR